MPSQQYGPVWGDTRPFSLKALPQVAAQQLIATTVRLLNLQLNNAAAGVDTVTLWDGGQSTGNDRLAVPVPANGSVSLVFMDIGIVFENGIVITESGGNTTVYALIADDV